MAYVLAFFGLLGALLGAYGVALSLTTFSGMGTVALLQASGLFVVSLLMLGAAEALVRLGDMAKDSRKLQQDMRRLADRVAPPPDDPS